LASALAGLVLLLHLAFVAFVVAGAALVWRWPRLAWLHLPAAAWGAFVEFSGTICPLTPLENHLRALAGRPGYGEGFVEHYLVPLVYPQALTRELQFALGGVVVALNALLYALLWRRRRRPSPTRSSSPAAGP
jgi:hypothetical protein